jgi:hypothetical protein
MKKAVLFICLIGVNLSFIACTGDSLAEVQEEMDIYAGGGNGGDDGQLEPPQEPPAGN